VIQLITPSNADKDEYSVPIYCSLNASLDDNPGLSSRFRLYFIYSGNGSITLGSNSLLILAPSLLCVSEKDSISVLVQNKLKVSVIYFHPSVINDSFDFTIIQRPREEFAGSTRQDLFLISPFIQSPKSPALILLGPGYEQKIRDLFDSFNNEITQPFNQYWPCNARSYLIDLLNIIQRLHSVDNPILASTGESEIDRIILYLTHNYCDKITISDLENLFCTNRTTLSKKFQQSTGHTLIEYLHKIRIYFACSFLKNSDLTVSDILYRTGFNDLTHFNRIFKRITGITPSQFRKQEKK
jgi:AraC-like DNA-binding protein